MPQPPIPFPDEQTLARHLEALAERLGIIVRYETLQAEGEVRAGGFCRIHGQDCVIIHARATASERISIFLDAVRRYDLGDIYVLPALREILDRDVGRAL